MTTVSTPEEVPATAFLSYAHSDNDLLNFAQPLVQAIKNRFYSVTGRRIEVFLDKNDIPLGANLDSRLVSAVHNSTVFLACVSGAYVRSVKCRGEFLEFLAESDRIGVQELLIPLLPSGEAAFDYFSDDEVVDYCKDHLYLDVEKALNDGSDSAEFRNRVSELVANIINAVSRSENSLAQREDQEAARGVRQDSALSGMPGIEETDGEHSTPEDDPWGDDDLPGLDEASEEFEKHLSSAVAHMEATNPLMEQLGNVVNAYADSGSWDRADLILLARKVQPLAVCIRDEGLEMRNSVKAADRAFRDALAVSQRGGLEDHFLTAIAEGMKDGGDLGSFPEQLTELLTAMRAPEAMSSALRKALRPMREGVVAMSDCAQVYESWRTISASADARGDESPPTDSEG